ncbi:MAG TPA: hypothetical protein DCS93_05025 [Microscillaceae bacterium]|nr:hypothetical protein [Microscillaceae bacterium]
MSASSGNLESSPIHNIRTLNPLEAIQVRPAMYLGDVGVRGLHEMLEVLLIRALANGNRSMLELDIDIEEDNSVIVRGNIGFISTTGEIQTEMQSELTNYKQATRPYGLSLAVINALSSFLKVTFRVGEKVYHQSYKQGKPITDLQQGENADLKGMVLIHFKPDETLFTEIIFDVQRIAERLWKLACLNQGVCFGLKDNRNQKKRHETRAYQKFQAKNGLSEFIPTLSSNSTLILSNTFSLNQTGIKIAFNYQASCIEKVQCYVNNNLTSWGGTHLTGFRRALTSSLKSFARNRGISEAEKIKGKDFKKGLIAAVSVNLENALFEESTKVKLQSPEVVSWVYTKLLKALKLFWEKYPKQAEIILYKAIKDYDKPLVKNNPRI